MTITSHLISEAQIVKNPDGKKQPETNQIQQHQQEIATRHQKIWQRATVRIQWKY